MWEQNCKIFQTLPKNISRQGQKKIFCADKYLIKFFEMKNCKDIDNDPVYQNVKKLIGIQIMPESLLMIGL